MAMNIYALIVSLFFGLSVSCIFLAVQMLRRNEVSINKFVPYSTYHEEERYKELEKIISKNKMPFKTAVVLIVVGGICIGITVYLIVGIWWVGLLGGLGGLLVPEMWYQWQRKSNKNTMLKQMEQASEVIATNIRTGSSISDAFQRASQDVSDPLKTELIRAATQIKIGVPNSKAIMELMQRTEIDSLMSIAVALQLRETGMPVNVAKLFEQLQRDIRENIRFQKEVQTITAQVKSSGLIVAAIPFFVILIMRLLAPSFIEPLFRHPVGFMVFCFCCFIIFIGVRWMFKIAELNA